MARRVVAPEDFERSPEGCRVRDPADLRRLAASFGRALDRPLVAGLSGERTARQAMADAVREHAAVLRRGSETSGAPVAPRFDLNPETCRQT